MKRGIWMCVVLGLAATGLAGCGEAEQAEQPEVAPAAAEFAVADARLMLPAVVGNPGALYFEVKNDGAKNRVLRAVSVAGASSAMMHTATMEELTQVPLPPGGNAKFAPAEQHVMAMNLADTVTAGTQAEVTLTFVGGDTFKFPAEVRAAGDER